MFFPHFATCVMMHIRIYVYIYVCRTFGVYLRKALVAIFNTMPSGAGPRLANLENLENLEILVILEILNIFRI